MEHYKNKFLISLCYKILFPDPSHTWQTIVSSWCMGQQMTMFTSHTLCYSLEHWHSREHFSSRWLAMLVSNKCLMKIYFSDLSWWEPWSLWCSPSPSLHHGELPLLLSWEQHSPQSTRHSVHCVRCQHLRHHQHFLKCSSQGGHCETLSDQDLFSHWSLHLINIHPDFWYSEISLVIYFSFCSVTIRQKFWRIRKVLWDLKIPNACSLWDYSSCFPLQDWCLEKKIFKALLKFFDCVWILKMLEFVITWHWIICLIWLIWFIKW